MAKIVPTGGSVSAIDVTIEKTFSEKTSKLPIETIDFEKNNGDRKVSSSHCNTFGE